MLDKAELVQINPRIASRLSDLQDAPAHWHMRRFKGRRSRRAYEPTLERIPSKGQMHDGRTVRIFTRHRSMKPWARVTDGELPQ
jgi:hypothetical protein